MRVKRNIMPITAISARVLHIHLQRFSKSLLHHVNQKDLITPLEEVVHGLLVVTAKMVFLVFTRNTPYLYKDVLSLHIPKYQSWSWLGFLIVLNYRNIFCSVLS